MYHLRFGTLEQARSAYETETADRKFVAKENKHHEADAGAEFEFHKKSLVTQQRAAKYAEC